MKSTHFPTIKELIEKLQMSFPILKQYEISHKIYGVNNFDASVDDINISNQLLTMLMIDKDDPEQAVLDGAQGLQKKILVPILNDGKTCPLYLWYSDNNIFVLCSSKKISLANFFTFDMKLFTPFMNCKNPYLLDWTNDERVDFDRLLRFERESSTVMKTIPDLLDASLRYRDGINVFDQHVCKPDILQDYL